MSKPTLYRLPVAQGDTAAGIYLGAVGAVAIIVFGSIWMTTQITAYRLHFHPALGTSLLTIDAAYRELLGPAAIMAAALGAGGLLMPAWRSAGAILLIVAGALLALRVGPLYAPLNFFIWWWRFGEVRGTELARAARRSVGRVREAVAEVEQRRLILGSEQPRREARRVQQPPEVVPRVRERGSCGSRRTARVDTAEDRL